MTEDQRHRLLEELAELLGRIVRLEKFMNTVGFGKLPEDDAIDLSDQVNGMRVYARALSSRVYRYL